MSILVDFFLQILLIFDIFAIYKKYRISGILHFSKISNMRFSRERIMEYRLME